MAEQAQDVAWILAWLLFSPTTARSRMRGKLQMPLGALGNAVSPPAWDSSSGSGLTYHPSGSTRVSRGCFGLACPGHTHSQVLHPQMVLQLWPAGWGDHPPPTEHPWLRNVTAPRALRASGQTEPVGKRRPVPRGPRGSSTSQASPASSPAACGAGHRGGRMWAQPGLPRALARPWFPAPFSLTGHPGACFPVGNHIAMSLHRCSQHG